MRVALAGGPRVAPRPLGNRRQWRRSPPQEWVRRATPAGRDTLYDALSGEQIDDQIAREDALRRRRDYEAEAELDRGIAERGGQPVLNTGAYDEDPPVRDPEADPERFDDWDRLVRGDATIVAGGGGSKGRRRHKPRVPSAEQLRERRRYAQSEDEMREPRNELVAGRVSVEAKKALYADSQHPIGEFLEEAGRLAGSGGRLGAAMRIMKTMKKTIKGVAPA